MKGKTLLFSLLLNLILVASLSFIIYKRGGIHYLKRKMGIGLAYPDSSYGPFYDQRKSIFESLPVDSSDILFAGHSLANGCEWAELFNNPRVKNRGINGEQTDGLLKRIDALTHPAPSKIFIFTGCNDLGKHAPLNTTMGNFQKIIQTIQTDCPSTKIYVLGLLPPGIGTSDNLATEIPKFNDELKKVVHETHADYIDLTLAFQDENGKFNSQYTNDGWHLMGKGYLKMKEVLQPYVN